MSCGCGCGGEVVAYEDWEEIDVEAAEYQGRSVTLNKPFRTQGGPKKFGVYTKNEKGNVVLVRFGDPNMEIKRDDPKRRKAFRDRHNCDNPGPKYKARYWSCRQWRGGKKVEAAYSVCSECEDEEYCVKGEHCMIQEKSAAEDPRSTPAPPKDRRKGSKKNKPGSAKPGGKVTFGESVTNSLKKKVAEHNKKSKRKVTLGMLKAVYRRGAGAYSTSHRPGVSRAAWSMARVNAFLKLVRSGSPSNSKYTQDNDLLPSGHPRKSKKASEDSCGCGCEDSVVAAEPTPKSDETHEEYMTRCMAMNYTKEECMKAHEGHKFKDQDEPHDEDDHNASFSRYKRYAYDEDEEKKKGRYASQICNVDEELIDGECRKVAVTLDLEFSKAEAILEATTGKTVIEITGIAFHEGMNKNKWSLTKEGAQFVAEQMVDSDLTLNHPKATSRGGFTRNMKGDIDEAVIGYITEATFEEREKGYIVRYAAHVVRTELFEALESGLWLRAGYGVSIGGSGVPVKADDDGLVFGEDFTFDHLAIVHKPAYNEANIESVKRVEAQTTIKYHSASDEEQQSVKIMTDEIIEDTNEMEALASQIEDLKAQVVLANSRVAEFEAADEARAEDERQVLVTEASEMGMKGHEDLSTETLRGLIASWVEAHPTPEPVEMKPVEEAVASETVVEASEPAPTAVVANYLNGKLVETDENLYEKAWNAWASAWNNTLARNEKDDMRAAKYSEIKEMI
tara:strand:- start:8204 stop:10402 length:2199 start_codon:yes stop_codon:yes gene_type:complete